MSYVKRARILESVKSLCRKAGTLEELLEGFGDLALEHVSDACSVDLVEDDGTIARYLDRHADLVKQHALARIHADHPLSNTSAYGYPRVIKTGKPQFFPGMTAKFLERLYPETNLQLETEGLRPHSLMCLPLTCRGRTLGAISFIMIESSSAFTTDDLHLAEEMAESMAVCIDPYRD